MSEQCFIIELRVLKKPILYKLADEAYVLHLSAEGFVAHDIHKNIYAEATLGYIFVHILLD
jgi:hypothetical protein